MDLKDQKYVYRQTELFKIDFFSKHDLSMKISVVFNELVPVAYQWLWDVSARRPPSTTRRYSRYNPVTSPRPNPFAGPITVYAQEHSCQPTLAKLEQFEKRAENCLFADKIEFFGKWLHPRAKLKKTDPT